MEGLCFVWPYPLGYAVESMSEVRTEGPCADAWMRRTRLLFRRPALKPLNL